MSLKRAPGFCGATYSSSPDRLCLPKPTRFPSPHCAFWDNAGSPARMDSAITSCRWVSAGASFWTAATQSAQSPLSHWTKRRRTNPEPPNQTHPKAVTPQTPSPQSKTLPRCDCSPNSPTNLATASRDQSLWARIRPVESHFRRQPHDDVEARGELADSGILERCKRDRD